MRAGPSIPHWAKALLWVGWAVLITILMPDLAFAKKVSVEWKEIKGAVQYEIEVQNDAGKVVAKKVSDDTSWSGNLTPGFYSYRLRAMDKIKRPGRWSEPRALVVMPPAPVAVAPEDGTSLVFYQAVADRTLKWQPVPGASRYLIEIKRGDRTLVKSETSATEFDLKSIEAGTYKWEVSAIIEAGGRAPASLQSRRWKSEPSDSMRFSVDHRKLVAPIPVFPLGKQFPEGDGRLKFIWKSVEGAQAYELRISRKIESSGEAAGRPPPTRRFIVREDSIAVPLREEGEYTWRVRALASVDEKEIKSGKVTAAGPESIARFEMDRAALFSEGGGYAALSSMIAPYTYRVVSPSTGYQANTASSSITARVSAEYWPLAQWGLAVGFDLTLFAINGRSYNRKNYEVHGKYRMALTKNRNGWFLNPKVGVELREYHQLTPTAIVGGRVVNLNETLVNTLGLSAGFDLRKQLSSRWSLGLKASYFFPLTYSSSAGGRLEGDANLRNFSVGLQVLYWVAKGWGLAAGGYLDYRSISFLPASSSENKPEKVYMDGVYFFGSLLYTFGGK